jgi:hypothetical protein
MKTRGLLAIGAISMLALRAHAQAPQQPSESVPRPTFKVEVNIIDVDATVTDEQGNPVARDERLAGDIGGRSANADGGTGCSGFEGLAGCCDESA